MRLSASGDHSNESAHPLANRIRIVAALSRTRSEGGARLEAVMSVSRLFKRTVARLEQVAPEFGMHEIVLNFKRETKATRAPQLTTDKPCGFFARLEELRPHERNSASEPLANVVSIFDLPGQSEWFVTDEGEYATESYCRVTAAFCASARGL